MSKREALRAWLDTLKATAEGEPLSGTLALARLVREMSSRLDALETKPAEKPTKADKPKVH